MMRGEPDEFSGKGENLERTNIPHRGIVESLFAIFPRA